MLKMYAFYDTKSGVFTNHFVSGEPFEKVKQNVAVSLLQLSLRDKTNPFVLFSGDWRLVEVDDEVPDVLDDSYVKHDVVLDPLYSESLSVLLAASRDAFKVTEDQTSPTAVSDNDLE